MNDHELVSAPRWSVVDDSDQHVVLLHRVSLAEALSYVGEQSFEPTAFEGELASLEALGRDHGAIVFRASRLGAYRRPRGTYGLRHRPFRAQAVLSWGSAPPLHDHVVAIVWDLTTRELPDPRESQRLPTLSARFVAEIGALVPAAARLSRVPSTPEPPTPEIPFTALQRLGAWRALEIARALHIPMSPRGTDRAHGVTMIFDGGLTLDQMLQSFDDMTPPARFSRLDTAGLLVFGISGSHAGVAFHLELTELASLGGLAARITTEASALSSLIELLHARLGGSCEAAPIDADPRGWLRAALSLPPAAPARRFEDAIEHALTAESVAERRVAAEAALLRATPHLRARLAERATCEPDPELQAALAVVVESFADHPIPSKPAFRAALQLLFDPRAARQQDGLGLSARFGTLDPARARELAEALGDCARRSDDGAVRRVARILPLFR